MFRRRNPQLLSQYICSVCGQRIAWGEILRVLRTDAGQPDYIGWEFYGHRTCLRKVLRDDVPLVLDRHWRGQHPMPDDSHQIEGRPCGFCGEDIAEAELTRLRIQDPGGLVRKPEFDEESVPVHTRCLTGRTR